MKPKKKIRLFVVRKYIWAQDASEAIKKESKQKPDDVWVDEEWKELPPEKEIIGFYQHVKAGK